MEIALLVAVPFLCALAAPLLRSRLSAQVQGMVYAAVMAVVFALFLTRLPAVQADGAQVAAVQWMPQIGLQLTFYTDGLALLFALLVSGIGVAVMLYTGSYFDDPQEAGRFFTFLLAFTGSMLGVVLAGNLLTLFVAWELTSITSFLLIGFKGKDAEARAGASQALVVTGAGGLALLAGLLLIRGAVGTTEFSVLLNSGDALREHPWYGAFAALILLGCFSKSAQFPLHFWLPGAMTAPTPASAFLHSATMVKAGIYLLARFAPVLGDTPLWDSALLWVGLATFAVGSVVGLRQRDLKAALAYSTIGQLGALVALIGLPHGHGIKAAIVGILAHALYKGALFLVTGAVDHAAGTRDITRLGGLRKALPGFAVVTGISALSMAGAPPVFGFVAKEGMLEALLEEGMLPTLIVTVSALLTVTLAIRIFWGVFMGELPAHLQSTSHEEGEPGAGHSEVHGHGSGLHTLPRWMIAGPAALAALSVAFGLFVPLLDGLVSAAAAAEVHLALFHGINTAFILSMVALGGGVLVFLVRRWWLALDVPWPFSGAGAFRRTILGVEWTGDLVLRTQGGRVRYYLLVILLVVVALLTLALTRSSPVIRPEITVASASDALKGVLLLLSLVGIFGSIVFSKHLLAVLSLGVAGYSVGGVFLLEPAPDVALVQFLVETLSTVLIIIILSRTSETERRRAMLAVFKQSRVGLLRDVLIAGTVGLAMTIFALAAVSSRPTENPISNWHLENAKPELGVTDVVAAIVTDFRGTDTLIEITVFSMASLGVLTMLARPAPGRVTRIWRGGWWRQAEPLDAIQEDALRPEHIVYKSHFLDPVTQLAAVIVLPFAFLIALAHILYGGVAPGDGFTAGVIGGLAIALWFVVFGYEEARRRLRFLQPGALIGGGLILGIGNAALPVLFGEPFLHFSALTTISIADIKLASTVLFEFAIFFTVLGGVSTIMQAITHPREVEGL